ncbi:MAG: 2-C-methyl-D-erythritol 4-phosphate cytidylyltransferase [Acidobacteria bacterium]|nr:2-C-methyl-D-erythritol 4-phosphate cytidylyltransferase [Acidobacteriota bacterium]NIQ29262.1 2-C-methyl-D-erythritol 4-phosphate cytidylyltransferase [Acidobacteriota bacterium]
MAQPSAPDFAGVIVAAGRSARFGGARPKQFLEIGGRLVVERSIDALAAAAAVAEVVVVVAADRCSGAIADRLRAHPAVSAVVQGGATRAASVAAGLAAVPAQREYVLVHDAARPLASTELVARVIDATRAHGAAIPVVGLADTVKRIGASGDVAETIDRSSLRLAQTPQGAKRAALIEALAARATAAPTDEAAALEAAGHAVCTVDGDARNVKITTAADMQAIRRSLEEHVDFRVGTGFDIHRVDPSRPLVLGGVHFEGEPGLAGHSDADVVLHAAMDAVLGAAGAGDIGRWFPPDDERWAGADSIKLAETVCRRIQEAGFTIVNLDLTVLGEQPKIGPRADEMRARIAAAFGIDPQRIGLKATTLERLGALGRHEGIACQSVALLSRRGS